VNTIEAVIEPFELEGVRRALTGAGVIGMTVTEVRASGRDGCRTSIYRGIEYATDLLPRTRFEVVVPDYRTNHVVSLICSATRAGQREAGTIFVSPLDEVIRISTGQRGEEAV